MRTQLDEDTVKIYYVEHSSKSFFSNLVQYMTSVPVLIMVLEKENAFADWRKLIGLTDAKKAKGNVWSGCRKKNCVHGYDSASSAEREMKFLFDKAAEEMRYAAEEQMKDITIQVQRKEECSEACMSLASHNQHLEYIRCKRMILFTLNFVYKTLEICRLSLTFDNYKNWFRLQKNVD